MLSISTLLWWSGYCVDLSGMKSNIRSDRHARSFAREWEFFRADSRRTYYVYARHTRKTRSTASNSKYTPTAISWRLSCSDSQAFVHKDKEGNIWERLECLTEFCREYLLSYIWNWHLREGVSVCFLSTNAPWQITVPAPDKIRSLLEDKLAGR